MPISDDLFLAILAMDAYNRGYDAGISGLGGAGTQIGNATVYSDSGILGANVDSAASFFAQAYTWNGQAVISYRGTDNKSLLDPGSDIYTGWPVGGGFYSASQAKMAAKFYQTVVQGNNSVTLEDLYDVNTAPVSAVRMSARADAGTRV